MTVSIEGVSLGQDSDSLGSLTPTKGRLAVGNGSAWTTLDVGTNTHVLTADSVEAVGVKWVASGSVTDHGTLTGLADDDHTQYVLADGTRAATSFTAGAISALTVNGAAVTKQLTVNDDALAVANILTASATAANGAVIYGSRSRGTTAAPTIVAAGDTLLSIIATGFDGTDFSTAASISMGTTGSLGPGANDMPGYIRFLTSADGSEALTERVRIDDAGRLLVGNSATRFGMFNSSNGCKIQLEGLSEPNATMSIAANIASAAGSHLVLGKSRAAAVGGVTVVQAGDTLGTLSFQGADGTELVVAAQIHAIIDGSPGANDMPGILVFSTTADAAATPTEAMRISQLQYVGINQTAPANRLHMSEAGATAVYSQFTNSATGHLSTDGMLVGVDASGNGVIKVQDATSLILGAAGGTTLTLATTFLGLWGAATNPGWTSTFAQGVLAGGTSSKQALALLETSVNIVNNAYTDGVGWTYIAAAAVGMVQAVDGGRIIFQGAAAGAAGAGFTPVESGSIYPASGMVLGSPTGGNQGLGTLNAVAVYDDGTLLTCYVPEAWLDGAVDFAFWDSPGISPPTEVWGNAADGTRVLISSTPKTHFGAHKFAARLGTDTDPLDIEKYASHFRVKRHLTSFPNRLNWTHGDLSTGAWAQRLVEQDEIQAVHIIQMHERMKALEAKFAACVAAHP